VLRLPRFLLCVLLFLLLSGCASNYYNVPRETYEKKVRVLGVAPLLLDGDSDIRHPEKGEILRLVREANRKNEKELVDILKSNGEYFAVRFLDEDPDLLQAALYSRRERRDDAGVVYNKYFYKPEELKRLVAKHNVDAVMLVTVSGVTTLEKVYSNNLIAYLEENYNNLIMTAQILDGDGTLLWEYPNFRQRFITFSSLLPLQYPDFEEARANLTDEVKIKNKSIPGIGRALTKTESSLVKSSKQVSELYNKQFSAMTSFLQYFRNPFVDKKDDRKPESAPPATPTDGGAPRPYTAPAAALPPPVAAPAPAAPVATVQPVKAAPREFESVPPGTEIIREPVIR